MKHLHLVNPYGSVAMNRMAVPLRVEFPRLYVLSEGGVPDPDADLNYHIPWHTLVDYGGGGRHAILYTHCNPPDRGDLLRACDKADLIICMSFTGRSELVQLGADPKKLHVIYAAADSFKFKRRTVGVIGFAQPNGRKRESILVDLAWKYDLSSYHFVIAGNGWDETIETLKQLGASVQTVGAANDEGLRMLYNSIDILLVTGYVEGGPLPLLEAMAAGVQVLSPRFGYASDLLDEAQLYDGPDELAEKMEAMTAGAVFRHQIARSWSWQDYAAETALVFGRLLACDVDLFPAQAASRYSQILDVIDEHRPRSIIEIGTWNGNRAIQMIQQAAKYHPMSEIYYTGFDLFEDMTGEHYRREMSKFGWPLEVVRRRLEATGANIALVKGDTNDTLYDTGRHTDLYFIDGGHSEATIVNDAGHVLARMRPGDIAIFDDFYADGKPEGCGCNEVIASLDTSKFLYNFLPVHTRTADGRLIGMVKVMLSADLPVYRHEQTYSTG